MHPVDLPQDECREGNVDDEGIKGGMRVLRHLPGRAQPHANSKTENEQDYVLHLRSGLTPPPQSFYRAWLVIGVTAVIWFTSLV